MIQTARQSLASLSPDSIYRENHVQIRAARDFFNSLLEKFRETIDQLKTLNIKRIVILGPVPVWKRTLPHTLVNFYRLHHTIADRMAAGVSGPEGDARMQAFIKSTGTEYISAWQLLCNSEGCMTRVGPSANEVVMTDNVHLSDAGSDFLIEGIKGSLFRCPEFCQRQILGE